MTKAGDVQYAFEADDGAIADACFVPEGAAEKWLAERRPQSGGRMIDPIEGTGCVWAREEAFESISLPEGRHEFVVRVYKCPAADCRLRVGTSFESDMLRSLNAPAT